MTRSASEYHLTVAVAQYLRAAVDIPHSHFPAGEQRDARTGAKLKHMGLQPGWPDFVLILPGGLFAGIELKAGKGRRSESQREFAQAAIRQGGCYALCTSLESVQETLRLWGVPLKGRVQ